jgi:methionyl-tRNA formyltransferase
MDAGAGLGQSSLEIGELETADELHDRLSADGAPLMLKVLSQLADGIATETPQDESQATIAPKMSRESSKLDFTHPSEELARQFRGMYPWPGCRVRLVDLDGGEVARLTFVRARPLGEARTAPGTIDPDGLISTGAGALELVELQPEGKKPMSLTAFRNGHRWDAKLRVEPVG